jgi:Winged helix DNA-binding domain
MTTRQIASLRLHNQQISGTGFTKPEELVSWMGCMQAQDYLMAKWAIGCRLNKTTDEGIENDLNEGKILRTHVLRPTWHFVSPIDIHWMLKLTAPRIKALMKTQHQQLSIDYSILKKSKIIIEKVLTKTSCLTRKQIQVDLAKGKINTDDTRMSFLLMDAELDGLICNAGRKGNQFAYRLLDEMVPKRKTISGDEALAEITKRYFTSHGPATLYDFAWWSGLSVTEAKKGLEMIKQDFISEIIGSEIYWFSNSLSKFKSNKSSVYILPAYDEFLISYKTREVCISSEKLKLVLTNNGIFKPIIVINGQVCGLWKREIKKGKVIVETALFQQYDKTIENSLNKQSKSIETFFSTSKKF